MQHTAKQGHTAGLQTKGLHGGGSHLGQFISGMGNNGLRRGIALLQGRVQQGGQGGNFLFGCGGGIGEADNRLHAWRTQALGDQLRQSCGGGTAIGSAHHGAQNIPSECIGTALVVDQMSPAAAAGFAAIGRAGVTDGTGACNQHSAHRLAQGTSQRRDLVANDLQRASVAACADDILNKVVSIRVADTCAADAKPIAPGQPFWLGS